MPHLVKVQTAIVIESWVEVQGASSPEAAAPLAEAHASSEAAHKYACLEDPRSDAIGLETLPDPEGDPPAVSCRTIPDPTPKTPPPAPTPQAASEPQEKPPEPAPAAPAIPDGCYVVDGNLLRALVKLRAAAENMLETGDESAVEHQIGVLKNLQIRVPLPAEIAALAIPA